MEYLEWKDTSSSSKWSDHLYKQCYNQADSKQRQYLLNFTKLKNNYPQFNS